MFAEFGPLVLDPKTRDSVEAFTSLPDSSRPPFLVTLDGYNSTFHTTKPQDKLKLSLQTAFLTLTDLHLSYPLFSLILSLPKHEHN
jgi:hypothetical protein